MDRLPDFSWVDKVSCAELSGPFFFGIIGIYSDDLLCAVGDTTLDDAETDATGTEDGAGRTLLDLSGSGRGTVTGCDTTSKETGLVEGSLGVNCDNRDIGDDYDSVN